MCSSYSPHMRKLYGDSLRKEAGFVKVIKNVASKNARILESRAGRHAPELKRVAKEVKGTFEKVFDEAAEAVEEFLSKCQFDYTRDIRYLILTLVFTVSFSKTNQKAVRCGSRHKSSAAAVERPTGHYVSKASAILFSHRSQGISDYLPMIYHHATPENTRSPLLLTVLREATVSTLVKR